MALTGRHTALSSGPSPDLDHRRDPRQEHISEDELPRDCQVCALAPVEEPIAGELLTEQDDLDRPDDSELAVVRITEFGARDDITEDLVPNEDPVTSLKSVRNELQRWIVGGVGALMALAMILSFILVLFRPSLAEFAGQFLQLVIGGLVGLAGSIVGFLLGRDKL